MNAEEKALIRQLVPFNRMSEKDLSGVLERAVVQSVAGGRMIFKRAQADDRIYWLLGGAVDLIDETFEAKHRRAGDDNARDPIDNHSPHRLTAVTTEDTRLLVCDRAELAGHTSGTGTDWMSTLLSLPLFEFIPPANIQALFGKFEEVKHRRGDTVITQGEQGDYFYVIRAGRAQVDRTAGGKRRSLAVLKPGDSFGQDALVSHTPRNATVTMTTDGSLMRLAAPDFQHLLVNPVTEAATLAEVRDMQRQGKPKTYIIDVRGPGEAERDRIPGSLNIPLLLLRRNLGKLRKDAVYATACDDGRRSALGAYLLNEKGYTAWVLAREQSA